MFSASVFPLISIATFHYGFVQNYVPLGGKLCIDHKTQISLIALSNLISRFLSTLFSQFKVGFTIVVLGNSYFLKHNFFIQVYRFNEFYGHFLSTSITSDCRQQPCCLCSFMWQKCISRPASEHVDFFK